MALPEGELVVNSSQGGGSKDTWVLGGRVSAATEHDVKAIVMEQATVTQAIPVITPAQLAAYESHPTTPQHSPAEDAKRRDQQQQQQQEGGSCSVE